MPIDYSKYPSNWLTEIRPRILERDKHKCKFCRVANYAIISRYAKSHRVIKPVEYAQIKGLMIRGYNRTQAIKILGFTKIVLTIAHLDQDINNNSDNNLSALCQRCHLKHDKDFYRSLRKLKQFSGQLTLQF